MTLKQGKSNGKPYLSIVQGYRDPKSGKVRTRTIQSLGYVDKLKEKYPDPIAYFTRVVEEMKQKAAEGKAEAQLRVDLTERLKESVSYNKNVGYAALSIIYRELKLDVFLHNYQARKLECTFDINAVMRLLVYGRILWPESKKKTYENKDLLFDKCDFSLNDVYRSLTYMKDLSCALVLHLHRQVSQQYGRALEPVYYDVTNYYFEIDEPDVLRRKGVSKEHRPDPIIQMGLLMDSAGIPITYKLFPGNTNDCETLIPVLREVKQDFGVGRLVVVADKGMNSSRNIVFNTLANDGYIYSQTIRGANKELKAFVLSEESYRRIGEDFKIKSRCYPRKIWVTDHHGKRKEVDVDEKQVAFYSRDYDVRAKAEREPALEKARDLVGNPAKYNRATVQGAARYVKNLVFDKETGEILTAKSMPIFDAAKLQEEEKYDGFYVIVSSECDKTDEEIVDIYRGLWKIEETFKVSKRDFKTRPAYVSREDHIQAHFLTCFVALVIARLLEKRLGGLFPISRIAQSLRSTNVCMIGENFYAFHFMDEVTQALSDNLGLDFSLRYRSVSDVKKLLVPRTNLPGSA
jgi:hypothetical protein